MLVAIHGDVVTLTIDIARPQGGTRKVSQEPLVQLEQQIGPPGISSTLEE